MSATTAPLPSANKIGKVANRIKGFGPTVFAEFSPLALKHKAVNLGQGFPDFPAPNFVKEAAQKAIQDDLNQYARSQGHLRLVNALSKTYSPILGRDINPLTEVVVTVGATEALFAAVQAFIDIGDEVIMFEPFYDAYPADVVMAGGVPRYIPLRPTGDPSNAKNWIIDFKEVENAINDKTKMIIINNPQNVPGKILDSKELQAIADLAIKYNLLVLSDEVYERLTFKESPPMKHIATLDGMWERTITVNSAGKTFSCTGFKIGWVIAPAELVTAVQLASQWIPFAVSTPLQEGIASALEQTASNNYFQDLKVFYENKKDKLAEILTRNGLTPVIPQGSYFMIADVSKVNEKHYYKKEDSSPKDYQFCRWLTTHIGVAAIPLTPFYTPEHAYIAEKYVRFTFCKTDSVLEEADKRLATLKTYMD